ncbi:MAG TPA: hypothetical protein VGC57_17175 [Cellulomonas sp.]
MRGARRLVLGVVLVALLGSCSGTVEHPDAAPTAPGWAAEIAQARSEATTAFEIDALADGVVSEAEFQEVRSRLVSCLTGYGYTDVRYSDTGGLAAGFPPGFLDVGVDEAQRVLDEQNADCAASSGERTVGQLYVAMRRNPDNRDEATILAECLVRRGAVEPGYTGADLDRDGDEGTGVFADEWNGDFTACNTDPLGILDAS